MMQVVFDMYVNGKKGNAIVVEDKYGLFSTQTALVKEVKYLVNEFKTHCYKTGGAYHPSHFVNYAKKYTRLTINYGFPVENVRLDF